MVFQPISPSNSSIIVSIFYHFMKEDIKRSFCEGSADVQVYNAYDTSLIFSASNSIKKALRLILHNWFILSVVACLSKCSQICCLIINLKTFLIIKVKLTCLLFPRFFPFSILKVGMIFVLPPHPRSFGTLSVLRNSNGCPSLPLTPSGPIWIWTLTYLLLEFIKVHSLQILWFWSVSSLVNISNSRAAWLLSTRCHSPLLVQPSLPLLIKFRYRFLHSSTFRQMKGSRPLSWRMHYFSGFFFYISFVHGSQCLLQCSVP